MTSYPGNSTLHRFKFKWGYKHQTKLGNATHRFHPHISFNKPEQYINTCSELYLLIPFPNKWDGWRRGKKEWQENSQIKMSGGEYGRKKGRK
jgi:hypothetical protein